MRFSLAGAVIGWGMVLGLGMISHLAAQAPAVIELTLEDAVGMAMDDSYRVQRVRLEIERTRRVSRPRGYREDITSLQRMTYYDFENDVPVLQRFGIAATGLSPGS